MNRPRELSLSAIIASKDAGTASLLRLSAVSLRRLCLVVPALCAMAYPPLLSLLSSGLVLVHGSASPNGVIVWVSVIASLTLALAVMLVSFVFGLALGSPHVRDDPEVCRARSIAHLAFATPTLYVGFGNVAYYVFQAPSAAPIDIVNHAAGLWNGSVHIAIMNVVRRVYRDDIVQPVLLALIGSQILSGTALVWRRMRMPSDFLGTVQTMSAVFVGVISWPI